MSVNKKEIYEYLAKLKSECLINSFDSYGLPDEKEIRDLEELRYKTSEDMSELQTKFNTAKSECEKVEQLIVQFEHENSQLNAELNALCEETKKLEKEEMVLNNKKLALKKEIESLKTFKIKQSDQEILETVKTKALIFKNLLGVKFDVNDLEHYIKGYVFNKKHVKRFSFKVSKYSQEEIVQMLWNLIVKNADTSDWPKVMITDTLDDISITKK